MDDDTTVLCQKDSKIRCTVCNYMALVSEFRPGQGNGGIPKDTYYYCPGCDDVRPKAYDSGTGKQIILGVNVELVE